MGMTKLRCVANIMSDHNFFDADPWQTMTYATEYGMHEMGGTTSTAELACDGLLGFGLPASTGTKFVTNLWNVAIPTGNYRYYDGALYTLALLHVSGHLPSSGIEGTSPGVSVPHMPARTGCYRDTAR